MPTIENRIKIAKSFDSAIHSYDISARLQRFTGKHLMLWLPKSPELTVIDLGCGTGFFTELLASQYQQVIGVDISSKMLSFCKTNRTGVTTLVAGDAYHLPFADNSIDVIYSNLVIQWCHPLDQALTEIMRVLKPGGLFVFTTLLDETLFELKSSWAQVDNDKHVIDFKTADQVLATFEQVNAKLLKHNVQDVVLEYENVLHLARELKGLGANHVPLKTQRGLSGKTKWQSMCRAYDDFVEPSGILPATYRVFSGIAVKVND
ncbi:malonyl-ACP O-methyltransferase BioC [Colwellia sp. MEBiC06753]